MIDFILAVRDPIEWHRENLKLNPSHYSFLKYAGANNIARIQNSFGARAYYNTLVPVEDKVIKYGVISRDYLIIDLLDWESLYVAGRLHKPVMTLYDDDAELSRAVEINLCAAMHTALLLLPESFSEQMLYLTITSLSYMGDFRMKYGEDRNKVTNIVQAQIKEFRDLYKPVLRDLTEHLHIDYNRGVVEQDVSPATKLLHLSMLPKYLQYELLKEMNSDQRNRDLEDMLRAAAIDPDTKDLVKNGVERIVRTHSLAQAIKGIFTAGITKSLSYSSSKRQKLKKSLQS